ncbi:MAG: family 1 glycosylhydrolase [Candidatus Poseidonia sp.]|nr:family 1 glycosylhydrolase [Poseidonia sp.]MBL6806978.1 family 1 glycosylhydrolase [Poseidonia sp.]MBL6892669.1 family 1 glycosylhydrolase [Poseidonia sp.]
MWITLFLAALAAFAVFKVSLISYRRRRYPEPHYDWSQINTDEVSFPQGFHWGTATAAHQVEGSLSNNWTIHEVAKGLEQSGAACDHWNRWKGDFQLLSDLGITSYRCSIEWSRLEPEPGRWDDAALQTYSAMIDELLARNIRPIITLHHFSHPQWWEARGGFTKKENIATFLSYCERVFDALSDRVDTWVTINEPTVFSTMGYGLGMFPPGRRSPRLTLRVMRHLMLAHAKVYHSLKAKRPEVQIGMAKNVTLFDPRNRWSPIDWPLSRLLEWLWNGAWRNGIMKGRMLFAKIPEAKNSLDFIGLNYYTHVLTGLSIVSLRNLNFPKRDQEVATEFGYPMYAEGFRRAIEFLAPLDVPIEITENGVADASDALRPEHLKRHLWVLSQAIKDGYNVRSYHHWSLMDNFEWAEGYSMRFGLYHVDFETQERTLRASGEVYKEIISSN